MGALGGGWDRVFGYMMTFFDSLHRHSRDELSPPVKLNKYKSDDWLSVRVWLFVVIVTTPGRRSLNTASCLLLSLGSWDE